MHLILLVLGLSVASLAAPLDDSKVAQLISYEMDNSGLDGYKFSYETSDGIKRNEEATIQTTGPDTATIVVRGSFSWVSDDGETYTVNFVADENGYQPEGAHLPK